MKTKTITLAGTAMAAVFATALALPAQAATQSNASAKEITRQLNEAQMQHPGVVNGRRAGPANTQLSQNDTGSSDTGTSSEDINTEGPDQNDQYNQNTGYSPNNQDNCQYNESTGNGPNDQANENCQYNQNTGYSPNGNDEGTTNDNYTPGAKDQGTGGMNQNDQYNQNTGYTPGASDQDNGAMENENNPQNTGYSGDDDSNSDMNDNDNSQMQNENMQSHGGPVDSEEMRRGVSLTDVPNASSELQNATIETRNGEQIGTVQSVEVNADGTPRAVDADVNGRQVSIDPNNLVYLRDQNALVTDLTRPELENLPPAGQSY